MLVLGEETWLKNIYSPDFMSRKCDSNPRASKSCSLLFDRRLAAQSVAIGREISTAAISGYPKVFRSVDEPSNCGSCPGNLSAVTRHAPSRSSPNDSLLSWIPGNAEHAVLRPSCERWLSR